jgi:hypothetical protein
LIKFIFCKFVVRFTSLGLLCSCNNWSLWSSDSLDCGSVLVNRGCKQITFLLLCLHRIASCLWTSSIVCAKMCSLVRWHRVKTECAQLNSFSRRLDSIK